MIGIYFLFCDYSSIGESEVYTPSQTATANESMKSYQCQKIYEIFSKCKVPQLKAA